MNLTQIIKEYKIQKNQTKLTRDALKIMIDRISCVKNLEDRDFLIRPDDICIGCMVSMAVIGDHWIINKRYEICPNFAQSNACQNSECKGYKNYVNYQQAKYENEIAEQKLSEYPFWVVCLGIFQRNK